MSDEPMTHERDAIDLKRPLPVDRLKELELGGGFFEVNDVPSKYPSIIHGAQRPECQHKCGRSAMHGSDCCRQCHPGDVPSFPGSASMGGVPATCKECNGKGGCHSLRCPEYKIPDQGSHGRAPTS